MPDLLDRVHAQVQAQPQGEPQASGDLLDRVHAQQAQPQDAGFFSTLYQDVMGAPKQMAEFISGHPVDSVLNAIRESTAARQEHLKRASDAYKAGDYRTAADHAFFGSVPFLGPALGAAAAEWEAGQKGQAGAHALEILGPALVDPAMEVSASRIGTAVKGGVTGGAKGAVGVTRVPLKYRGVSLGDLSIPVPNVVGGAVGGAAAARVAGVSPEAGAIAGGAAPIVSGAVQGARNALAERAMMERIGVERPTGPPGWQMPSAPPEEPPPPPPPGVPPPGAPAGPGGGTLPSGKIIPTVEDRAALAAQPSTPGAPAAPAIDPEFLEDLAQTFEKKSFSRLTDKERANVLATAQRMTQPAVVETPPPPQPNARVDIGTSIPGKSIGQMLDEELAARRAAAPPAAAPEVTPPAAAPASPSTPPQPGIIPGQSVTYIGDQPAVMRSPEAAGYASQLAEELQRPVEPPVAAAPAAPPATETIAPATEPVVPKRTAEEATAYNRGNKVQRFVDALRNTGLTSEDVGKIESGYVSSSQIQAGMTPRWGNIAESLGEDSPGTLTVKQIINKLKEGEPPPPNPLQAAVAKNKAAVQARKAKLTAQEPVPTAQPEVSTPPAEPAVSAPVETPPQTELAAQPETKQPWQMTRAEYVESRLSPEGQTRTSNKGFSRTASLADEYKQKAIQGHRNKVAAALQQGETVPPEVLADYPDLASKASIPPGEGAPTSSLSGRLQDSADAAIERVRKRGTFKGTKLSAGVPVDDLGDMAIWGAAKLAKGTVDFANWSKEMLADAGEQIKPHLEKMYADAQKIYSRHIATTENSLANTKQLLKLNKLGAAGKDWYTKTHAELVDMFGPDAVLMEKFLAATSPNNTVAGNVSQALKAYRQYRLGQPFEGYLPIHKDMLNAAVQGEDFGGLKVHSFLANLAGDAEAVTVDRWIRRAFGFKKPSITDAQYKFMDYTLTQIAKRNGMEPRQLQAAIWTAIKEADERGAATTSLPFEALLPKKLAADPQMQILIQAAKGGEIAPARP